MTFPLYSKGVGSFIHLLPSTMDGMVDGSKWK